LLLSLSESNFAKTISNFQSQFAGGTEIRVWDCLGGGRLLSKISQHHKTITCLQFASNYKRLASASLDRHVKIYEMTNFEVIQTIDYSSPILSLGISVSFNPR